jgi:hypothetical protein
MFRPSPCLGHYAERLTTMPFADFCSITAGITSASAVGLHHIRSCWMDAHPQAKTLITNALLVIDQQHVEQISPDKNLYCPCATASFTVVLGSHGFVVLHPKRCAGRALPTRLGPTPPIRFLFINSQFCSGLPSDNSSRNRPCRSLAVSANLNFKLTVIFLQRTFTSLVQAHAGRTQFV